MNLISILFLVAEILIIAGGAVIAYHRGVGRSIVRVVYLAIIGVATFFIARAISSAASTPIFNTVYQLIPLEDVKHLLEKSPELDALIANLIGALMTPVIFAVLFLALQLITLIFFNTVSGSIVSAITSKKEAPSHASKFIGAGVGLVSAVAVAAILLSPVYTAIHVIDNTSDETVAIILDKFGLGQETQQAKVDSRSLKAGFVAAKFDFKPNFEVTNLHPLSDLISEAATSYEVPEAHEKESAAHALPVLVDALSDILYVHKSTLDNGGSSMDALNNSVASVALHLEESITVKDAAASALAALGEILIEDGQFMGIALPKNSNALVEGITNNVLDTMSHTTLDTVEENMIMIFGTVGDDLLPEHERHDVLDPLYATGAYDGKAGLLVTMNNMKNNKELSQQDMLKQALEIFEGNAEMTTMINDMLADYIADQIPEDVGIGKDVIKDILDNSDIDITEIDLGSLSKEDILGMVTSGDIVIDDETLKDIQAALGNDNITKEDIDNFLENGGLGDVDLGDVDLGDIDLGDVDLGDVDLGDVDLGDVDLGDIDISNISLDDIILGNVDVDDLDPAIIDALRAQYGDIVDMYLN